MNIFNSLRVYAGSWAVSGSRSFTEEEIGAVAKAQVVDSQYGYSVCFFMRGGGQTYIPLSNTSSLAVGATVDLTKARLLTLSREGDDDIMRVEA